MPKFYTPFPSPLGELYFLIEKLIDHCDETLEIVSVPSRGAIFLNDELSWDELAKRLGFRPLSGSYIS